MSPAQILASARNDGTIRMRFRQSGLGFWSNGRVHVTADRYDGHWQYAVDTDAKRYAYGRPADVLETLATLLQEYPA